MKINKDNFREEFEKIHGDKYNYDRVIYKNNSTKIKIECPTHGIFEQCPKEHLKGHTCLKCYHDSMKLTKEKFIEKAIGIHGDKYNYDDIIYTNSRSKITIECPIHGKFEQQANNHLNGQGCTKCAGTYNYSNLEFINKAIGIHGNKYNYDKVIYKNSNSRIIINCPSHGEFIQRASSHLEGTSCIKCGFDEKRYNTDEFINKSIEMHGNRYIYIDTNYTLYNSYVKIKCKVHGDFIQKPSKHLNGQGCPMCNISKGELKISKILEDSKINYKPQYTFSDLKHVNILHFDFGIIYENEKVK